MVGRRRATAGRGEQISARGEGQRIGRIVVLDHDREGDRAANRRAHDGGAARARRRDLDPGEASRPASRILDVPLGGRHELDRALVGLARLVAEGDQAVVDEHDAVDGRARLQRLEHGAREIEAGAHPRQHGDAVAEDASQHVLGIALVGQRDDGVGVGVVDPATRDEAVQQRLDRGSRVGRVEQGVREVVDHRLVGQRAHASQPLDILLPDAREVAPFDGFEVGSAALHAQHVDGFAAEVLFPQLDGGVAAAPHHQRGLRAQQAGGVDAQIQHIAGCILGRVRGRPTALHAPHPSAARAGSQSRALALARSGLHVRWTCSWPVSAAPL